MEINIVKNQKNIVLELTGSLDIYTSVQLKVAVENHASQPSMNIIVDMEKLNYLDSSGIGILIKTLNYCKEHGSKLRVVNLQPAIEKVFRISGLTSYFEILSPEDYKKSIQS